MGARRNYTRSVLTGPVIHTRCRFLPSSCRATLRDLSEHVQAGGCPVPLIGRCHIHWLIGPASGLSNGTDGSDGFHIRFPPFLCVCTQHWGEAPFSLELALLKLRSFLSRPDVVVVVSGILYPSDHNRWHGCDHQGVEKLLPARLEFGRG
jgi:hypothetical protein